MIIIKDIKLNKLKGFKSFTVSSKNPIRLINLVKMLNKILSKKLKINIGKKIYRLNTPVNPTLKIFNYPGWKPKRKLFNELKKIFLSRFQNIYLFLLEIIFLGPLIIFCFICRFFKKKYSFGIGPEPLINNIAFKKNFKYYKN